MTKSIMAPSENYSDSIRRVKFGQLLQSSQPNIHSPFHNNEDNDDDDNEEYTSDLELSETTASSRRFSFSTDDNNPTASPYSKSPWIKLNSALLPQSNTDPNYYFSRSNTTLIASLLREEGHVYSLAVNAGVLYTGSESKNIRVWVNLDDAGGFKSGSGFVKAIVVSGDGCVFSGHQDGKIRIWSTKGKRIGTLPKMSDFLKSSLNPKSYVQVRRHHKVPRIKHYDAVSCLSLNEGFGLLYSGSWDKTIKVWRLSDWKCLESIDEAHDDAINSIVVGPNGHVFSGSADGTVKMWRREIKGRKKKTRHYRDRILRSQESAVTSLAVADDVLYCGSSDGLVNFWVRVKEELQYGGVLRGHKLAVLCLATAGSMVVLSGSADKTICVWKNEGGGVHSCLAVLAGHSGPVKCLAVEEDHDDHVDDDDDDNGEDHQRQWIVYSGSLDKSVRVWRVSDHAPDEST